MRKILIVIPQLGIGGAERLVSDLIYGLDKTKYEIHLLYFYKSNSFIEEKIKKCNINIHFISKKIGFDLKAMIKVKKLVNGIKPDVIHTHLDSLFVMLFAFNKKIHIYHTVHNIANEEASGKQKKVRKYCIKKYKMVMVAISNAIKKSIESYYSIDKANIPVIYNGIDIKKYNFTTKKEDNMLISVGRLTEQKNFFEMISIIERLNKKCFVKILIIGDGQLKEKLIKEVHDRNLEKNIFFLGEKENVAQYLKLASVYLCTSKYEGLPLSILEAMAAGLPIVATKVGGIPDVISNGENGFLYEQGNIEDATNKIRYLLENKEFSKDIEINNLEKSKRYDISECVKKYEKLYDIK